MTGTAGSPKYRSDLALGDPPSPLSLPETGLRPGPWFREHQDRPGNADRGCWYFASRPADGRRRPGGRFDLPAPEGTCYVAETEGVAARERCGRFLSKHMLIPPEFIEGRVVSEFDVPPTDGPVADLTDPEAAQAGVTAEIHTVANYWLTTRWAKAAREEGYGALLYQARYTPGRDKALALFGAAGVRASGVVAGTRLLAEVLSDEGYQVGRSTVPTVAVMASRVDDDSEPEDA